MSEEAVGEAPAKPNPTLLELALCFNQIAIASFGGGLSAWSRQVLVEDKKWMEDEEFLSASTLCRVLPGANQVNLAVFVGSRFRGLTGAGAAVVGLTLIPMVIVIGLGWFYFTYSQVPALKSILNGISPVAVALSAAMAFKAGKKCLNGVMPVAFAVAMFVLSTFWRLPLLESLAVLGPLAVWWAWPRDKKTKEAA
ncbi:MAG TPA: chromate transporter [Chthoniobacterales bacterium]